MTTSEDIERAAKQLAWQIMNHAAAYEAMPNPLTTVEEPFRHQVLVTGMGIAVECMVRDMTRNQVRLCPEVYLTHSDGGFGCTRTVGHTGPHETATGMKWAQG